MTSVERIKNWYRGRHIQPPLDPDGPVHIDNGHYEQPALAKMLGALGRFYLAHWKWIIGTTLGVVALYLKAA